MPVARLLDAPRFEAGAIAFASLATPSRGTTELSTWRAELAPHASSGVHSLDHEQLMIVGEGVVDLRIGDEISTGRPGDVLILPPGHDVELRNETAAPAAVTVVCSAGFKATANGRTFCPPWSL